MMTRCISAGKSEHEHSLLDSSKIALAVMAFKRSFAILRFYMNCKNFPSLNLLHVVLMENQKEMLDTIVCELLKLLLTLHTAS